MQQYIQLYGASISSSEKTANLSLAEAADGIATSSVGNVHSATTLDGNVVLRNRIEAHVSQESFCTD